VIKKSAFGPQYALSQYQIGSIIIHDVPTWFSGAATGKFAGGKVAGLIGNNALDKLVVTLNYKTKMAYIEQP
jgi:hypothetical protein